MEDYYKKCGSYVDICIPSGVQKLEAYVLEPGRLCLTWYTKYAEAESEMWDSLESVFSKVMRPQETKND